MFPELHFFRSLSIGFTLPLEAHVYRAALNRLGDFEHAFAGDALTRKEQIAVKDHLVLRHFFADEGGHDGEGSSLLLKITEVGLGSESPAMPSGVSCSLKFLSCGF
jgi:hypothetical protein